eukprot:4104065-Alexandrium_andersonii.AAC.1
MLGLLDIRWPGPSFLGSTHGLSDGRTAAAVAGLGSATPAVTKACRALPALPCRAQRMAAV